MKTTLHLLLFVFALSLPLARTHAQSQHEMNQQAAAAFKKADATLNKIYAQVLAKLDDLSKTIMRISAQLDSLVKEIDRLRGED